MSYDPHYAKQWHYARSHGIHQWVDVQPARAHVRRLTAAGFSALAIATAADISATAVRGIDGHIAATATRHINRRISRRILRLNARHILDAQTDDSILVPAVGSKRRVQALMTLGHTLAVIDAHTGHRPRLAKYVLDRRPGMSITLDKHRAIERAFEALWDVRGTNKRVRGDAARRGYAPPAAWDESAIDDPNAQPAHMAETRAGTAERIEDVEWVLEHNPHATLLQIAERLGVERNALHVALGRAGRDDLRDRLADNAELAGFTVRRRTA